MALPSRSLSPGQREGGEKQVVRPSLKMYSGAGGVGG